MGSRSSSKQSTTNNYETNYTYTTLDGGAINSAFDFGSDVAGEAFDAVGNASDNMADVSQSAIDSSTHAIDAVSGIAGDAFSSFDDLSQTAFDFGGSIADEAFDSLNELSQTSIGALANQNNNSLASLGALQSENSMNNQKTLASMSDLVNSVQTQGATELIKANQTTTIVIVIALVAGLALMWRSKR